MELLLTRWTAGGQAVANMINAPGFCVAGYTNISTSDAIVHGQVKQSGNFAFGRIYESGHEVPFYQPLAALEIFNRTINGKDIATGMIDVKKSFKTKGPMESTYREGNATIQFEVLPDNAIYNTTTNKPNPAGNGTSTAKRSLHERKIKGSPKSFRPMANQMPIRKP